MKRAVPSRIQAISKLPSSCVLNSKPKLGQVHQPAEQLDIANLSLKSLLQLQSTLGNRTLVQLLQEKQTPAKKPASKSVIQRTPILHKPRDTSDILSDAEKSLWAIAKTIDAEVDNAYQRFIRGDYDGASQAQIDLYKLRKYEFDNSKKTIHPSTAAGYVIEGMVNAAINGMDGVDMQVTNLLPGTRPDVLITLSSGEQALLDITASNSAGHILGKKGNWLNHSNILLVLESVYPSIDFKNMSLQTLSAEDLERIQERVKHDAEMKALMEEQRQALQLENYQKRQNTVYHNLIALQVAFQQQESNEYEFRTSQRNIENFRKFGLSVSIDSSINKWEIERMDYDEWKKNDYRNVSNDYERLIDNLEIRVKRSRSQKKRKRSESEPPWSTERKRSRKK